jgi:glucose/arabinose dehydrogenase
VSPVWTRLLALALLLGLLSLACRPATPAAPGQPGPQPRVTSTEAAEASPADDNDESEGAKPGSAPTATPRPLPTSTVAGLRSEVMASGLSFPSALAFAPDGRLFFVEVKTGVVRVLDGKTLQPEPVVRIAVDRGSEHGLIGLALDPDFSHNHYIYTFYTEAQRDAEAGRPRRHRLTRWTEQNGQASGEVPILDNLPVGKCCHTGGKLAFAADGTLFMTIGDQGDADRRAAQNPNKVNGSILHFGLGEVVAKGGDPTRFIYAKGLRNPYGLDLHPVTGAPFVTDNGPDMCDELDLGHQGANFGNPVVECSGQGAQYDDPIWDSGVDRLGVTGLRIYRGPMFPDFANHPLFCSVNTGNLMHAVLPAPGYDRVDRVEQVVSGANGEGCRLDLAIAPDGAIYYASFGQIFRLSRG